MQARSPLARPCTLSDDCDTGAVAPDYGVGQLSVAIHCPATERPRASKSPRCDALRLAHCPSRQIRTIQGFLSTRGSGPVMIAVLQRERSSLKWRPRTRDCNVIKRKEALATPRSCRVGTVGDLARRLGDARPVSQPFVCRPSLSRRGGRQHHYV